MDINKELKEWIDLFCLYDNTDYINLSEVRMLQIIDNLREDLFTNEEIDEAIYQFNKKINN